MLGQLMLGQLMLGQLMLGHQTRVAQAPHSATGLPGA
jgi:hypothetical protein